MAAVRPILSLLTLAKQPQKAKVTLLPNSEQELTTALGTPAVSRPSCLVAPLARTALAAQLPSRYADRSAWGVKSTDMKTGSLTVSPDVVSGAPVFKGTRVPVRVLLDHLEGSGLETFLEDFPSVSREQAVRFIELATEAALAELYADTA